MYEVKCFRDLAPICLNLYGRLNHKIISVIACLRMNWVKSKIVYLTRIHIHLYKQFHTLINFYFQNQIMAKRNYNLCKVQFLMKMKINFFVFGFHMFFLSRIFH